MCQKKDLQITLLAPKSIFKENYEGLLNLFKTVQHG